MIVSKVKTDGFTLLEMLFVILLTSIVVLLTFAYFNTFQQYLHSQAETNDYETEILRFESLLHRDIDSAEDLNFSNGRLTFENSNIEYRFRVDKIIRYQGEESDTLNAKRITIDEIIDPEVNLLVGLDLFILDDRNRERQYSFYLNHDVKSIFEAYLKQ